MTTAPQLLEHATELFPPPEPAFERLLRRRDRKRRNQRIAAAVVALAVAALAIGNVLVRFRAAEHPRPADRSIDVGNVGQLTLTWRAVTSHIGVGWTGGASAGEGVLLVATSGRLSAYDAGCGVSGATCTPMWTSPGRYGPLLADRSFQAAIISDGAAYVPGRDGLYAFALRCRTDGGVCTPTWIASLRGDFTSARMTLADGELYGTFGDPRKGGGIYAIPADCGSSTCDPDWIAHGWQGAVPSGGMIFATSGRGFKPGAVGAFPASCRTDGGECAPSWTAPRARAFEVAGVLGSNVLVNGRDGLYAYPTTCSDSPCEPRWRAGSVDWVTPGDGVVFGTTRQDGLVAFANDCGSGGATCRPSWSAPGAVPMFVADGLVIASRGDGVAAFATHCRRDGGVCTPEWTSQRGGTGGARTHTFTPTWIGDGLVYGGLADQRAKGERWVVAYALDCATGGAVCAPAWRARVPGTLWDVFGLSVDGDRVYAVTRTSWMSGTPTNIFAYGLPGPEAQDVPTG